MPRRKSANAEKKRVLIQLRTTEEDKRTLREFAKMAGMTITDFVKSRTLDKPPRTKKATPDREVLLHLLTELSKVGSNVNQIAKVMNTDNKTFYSVSVKETLIAETLNGLNQVSSRILDTLEPNTDHGHNGKDQG